VFLEFSFFEQVDLVKRENERLNRQIEILSNKFKTKLSSDVLVREGWLDKRSERLHQANARHPVLFGFNPLILCFRR
jgi:hypothetical protein